MLAIYHGAPFHTITASKLAEAMNFKNYNGANLRYGPLARKINKHLDLYPDTDLLTLVTFNKSFQGEWEWTMRLPLVKALQNLGIASIAQYAPPAEFDEIALEKPLIEGATYTVLVNAYERNPAARLKCIQYWGNSCMACGFNFRAAYGEDCKPFIQVHHLRPLSDINESYIVNPIEDLRPVCPNCHAVIPIC